MKIVKILGGLGNQMFQYALYLSLKDKYKKEKIFVDIKCFKGYPLHNGFELERIFAVSCHYASWKEIAQVSYPYPNYRFWQMGKILLPNRKTMYVEPKNMEMDLSLLDREGNVYYDGYWQHEEYFKDIRGIIIKAFAFPAFRDDKNKKILDLIEHQNSVSIHVRRGDYLNHPYFKGICGVDYYRVAITYMMKKVKPEVFLVFSNDVKWCEQKLQMYFEGVRVIYVDWNKGENSYKDMQLMSCCKHNIIANSSFSWWGAWLNSNPKKVVVAPQKWMNMEMKKDPICDSWQRV